MGKSEEKKRLSHTMGLRLDQETYTELEQLSQEMQIAKSTLLKKALNGWATIRLSTNFENMIVIGKPMLKYLMGILTEDQAIELTKVVSSNIYSVIANRILERQKELSVDSFLNFFASGMGMNGKGWFDKIQVQKIANHTYRLFGTHRFGKNFSSFVFHLITNIIEDIHDYETKKDLKIQNESMVSILISKKET